MPFSIAQLREIAARAAPLCEWIEAPRESVARTVNDSDAENRLKIWIESCGGRDKWLRRLQMGGWNETQARRAASGPPLASEELPLWARALNEIFGASPQSETKFEDENEPFDAAFSLWVRWAAREVSAAFEALPVSARCDLEAALRARLSMEAAPALDLEFCVARKLQNAPADAHSSRFYHAFQTRLGAGGWEKMLLEWPVLARQMASFCLQWRHNTRQMLERLQCDRARLEAELGLLCGAALRRVQTSLSDPHNGGQSVAILRFDGDFSLVYKPKSIAAEAGFFRLLERLNARGAPQIFAFPRVLVRQNYGWAQRIEAAPLSPDGAPDFYRRGGALLAVLQAVDATDCHCDNLIAAGDFPVLVDAEALWSPRVALPPFGASERAPDESVLRSGMLPFFELGPRVETAYDISALGGAGENGPSGGRIRRAAWQHPNSDAQHRALCWHNAPLPANAPFEAATFIAPHETATGEIATSEIEPGDYVAQIAQGYAQTHRFLRIQRAALGGELRDLASHRVRWIFRATGVYGALLERARQPQCLRDGWAHSAVLDGISRAFGMPECREMWPIHEREWQDLERGDIPLFTVSPLEDSPFGNSLLAGAVWEGAPFALAMARFEAWSEENERDGCDLIQAVFRAREAKNAATRPGEKEKCPPPET